MYVVCVCVGCVCMCVLCVCVLCCVCVLDVLAHISTIFFAPPEAQVASAAEAKLQELTMNLQEAFSTDECSLAQGWTLLQMACLALYSVHQSVRVYMCVDYLNCILYVILHDYDAPPYSNWNILLISLILEKLFGHCTVFVLPRSH